mgnify:FL=1
MLCCNLLPLLVPWLIVKKVPSNWTFGKLVLYILDLKKDLQHKKLMIDSTPPLREKNCLTIGIQILPISCSEGFEFSTLRTLEKVNNQNAPLIEYSEIDTLVSVLIVPYRYFLHSCFALTGSCHTPWSDRSGLQLQCRHHCHWSKSPLA